MRSNRCGVFSITNQYYTSSALVTTFMSRREIFAWRTVALAVGDPWAPSLCEPPCKNGLPTQKLFRTVYMGIGEGSKPKSFP